MRNVLTAAFLSSLLFYTGCQYNPATGRHQLIAVAGSDLERIGAEAEPQLISEYGGEVPESQLRQYVTQIGQRLARHVEPEFQELDWQFTALNSDVINAFALPGGRVFITRGLMARLNNEAEIAAVLGHEIGHATGRHIDERISRAAGLQLLGGLLTEGQIAQTVFSLFGTGYLLSFGRDQEAEADELGLRYMAAAGYDPHAVLGVLNVLMEEGRVRTPEFLSTHPHPETRLATVQRLLDEQYAHTRNNPDFRLFEGRFRQEAAPYLRGEPVLGAAP